MAVTFFTVVTMIGVLLVECADVVPCDAFLAEPTETTAEVMGIFVVAMLVDDSVLPLVVASIPRVVKFVLVLSPVSTEVVFVEAVEAA